MADLPSVDSILGEPPKPRIDDILGPAPEMALQRQAESPEGRTAISRVLDAFGQGIQHGFGDERLGLSDETLRIMQKNGLAMTGTDQDIYHPFAAFNEAILRPLAFAWDVGSRSFSAAIGGVGAAASQAQAEVGMMDLPPEPQLASEQAQPIGQIVMMAQGVPLPRVPRARLIERAQETGVLGDERPKIPADVSVPKSADGTIEAPAAFASKSVQDTAGNINLKNINSPEDVKDVIRETANSRVIAFGESSPFIEARRGTQSNAMTRDLAQQLGMTPEQLAKRQTGQTFNAEEALAARNLLVQSAANVKELSAKVAGGSDQALLEFEEAVTRHVAIQEQVAGMTAEAGRALQSFRIKAGEAIDVKALIERAGGRDRIEDLAAKIQTLEPEQVGAFVRKARKATTVDMVREFWVNSILSAFRTHEANIIGNTLTALARIPETAVAGAIGKLHGGEKVFLGETGAAAFGLVQGARDGLVAAWKALKAGEPSDLRGKIEVQAHKAIPGAVGEVVRVPGRLLMAEDEFFKTVNYRAEINRQAVRKATAAGLKGRDYQNEVARLAANPTEKMIEKARESALYNSFQAELGQVGQYLMKLRDNVPGGWLVAPFVRTPINITKYAAERSPLGILMRDVRANLKGENGNIARDTAIARMAIGTSVGYATYSLAAEGIVSGGGPADPAERAMLRASGWQPYSVKIGDKWYAYNRLDPFGLMMGVAADAYELRTELAKNGDDEKIGAMIVGSVSTALLNKTWLSGPSQLMAAIQDPERYGDAYVRRLAGSVVPAGVAQFAPEIDPVLRDARSMLDAIKLRVPGMSHEILPKRDVFGEEIKREGTVGGMATPISESTIRQDPVVNELLNLEIYPAPLDRQIKGVDLTAQQYDEFQVVAGRLMKIALTQAVTQPGWAQAPEFARKEVVTALINSSREQGRAFMLMHYPQILEDAIKLKTAPFAAQ